MKLKEKFEEEQDVFLKMGRKAWTGLCVLAMIAVLIVGGYLLFRGLKFQGVFILIVGILITFAVAFIGWAVFAHFENTVLIRNKLYENNLEDVVK